MFHGVWAEIGVNLQKTTSCGMHLLAKKAVRRKINNRRRLPWQHWAIREEVERKQRSQIGNR